MDVIPLWGKEDDTWRKRNAHLFKSDPSFIWWWRDYVHRKELIDAGVITMLAGRAMTTNPERTTELVIQMGQRDAIRLYEENATQA